MYSSPLLMNLRSVGRKLGLNRLASRLFSHGYEDRFGPALLAEVRSGDTVWDVGANVGLYSVQFAERAGERGRVVAFEPVPACFAELERATQGWDGISLVNVALGSSDGHLTMALEEYALAATHRVVESRETASAGGYTEVSVRSAESFVDEHPELFPNLIKVDVEGFEGAVFDGMQGLLADPRLRCIGIEVHFGLLQERGEAATPRKLEQGLREQDFRVTWTDASHLFAVR